MNLWSLFVLLQLCLSFRLHLLNLLGVNRFPFCHVVHNKLIIFNFRVYLLFRFPATEQTSHLGEETVILLLSRYFPILLLDDDTAGAPLHIIFNLVEVLLVDTTLVLALNQKQLRLSFCFGLVLSWVLHFDFNFFLLFFEIKLQSRVLLRIVRFFQVCF